MSHHDEPDVRHALGSLVIDEPALGLRYEQVARDARRLRLRRRSLRLGTPIAALSLVAAGVAWGAAGPAAVPTTPRETALPPVDAAAQSLPLTDSGRAATTTGPRAAKAATSPGALALEAVVRQASPAGWTFTFDATDWAGFEGGIDAVVNDGTSDGSISLASTKSTGMLTVHPCKDSEFRQGATCSETRRADGSFLTIRGLVDYHGVETILVSITRKNGTGTFAEAGNYTPQPDPAPGTVVTAAEKAALSTPTLTRPDPSYTIAQLTALVEAADGSTR